MSSDTFQHLSEGEVKERLARYLAEGMSEDEAFNEIYAEDCNMDD